MRENGAELVAMAMNRGNAATALKLMSLVPSIDVNWVDGDGRTVLMLACVLDMPGVAKECVKRGASI